MLCIRHNRKAEKVGVGLVAPFSTTSKPLICRSILGLSTSSSRQVPSGYRRLIDEDLQVLWTFKRLKQVNLRGANVTDAGLRHLLSLSALEKLNVLGTKVTAKGLATFQARKPNCLITNDEA